MCLWHLLRIRMIPSNIILFWDSEMQKSRQGCVCWEQLGNCQISHNLRFDSSRCTVVVVPCSHHKIPDNGKQMNPWFHLTRSWKIMDNGYSSIWSLEPTTTMQHPLSLRRIAMSCHHRCLKSAAKKHMQGFVVSFPEKKKTWKTMHVHEITSSKNYAATIQGGNTTNLKLSACQRRTLEFIPQHLYKMAQEALQISLKWVGALYKGGFWLAKQWLSWGAKVQFRFHKLTR